MHSLIPLSSHLFIHPLDHPFFHPFIHPPTHAPIHCVGCLSSLVFCFILGKKFLRPGSQPYAFWSWRTSCHKSLSSKEISGLAPASPGWCSWECCYFRQDQVALSLLFLCKPVEDFPLQNPSHVQGQRPFQKHSWLSEALSRVNTQLAPFLDPKIGSWVSSMWFYFLKLL